MKASHTSGGRILLSRTQKNDTDYELRINAGELVKIKRNVVLLVNTQAKSTALKDWLKKQGTYAKLTIASFDTAVTDPEAEARRILDKLEKEVKANI